MDRLSGVKKKFSEDFPRSCGCGTWIAAVCEFHFWSFIDFKQVVYLTCLADTFKVTWVLSSNRCHERLNHSVTAELRGYANLKTTFLAGLSFLYPSLMWVQYIYRSPLNTFFALIRVSSPAHDELVSNWATGCWSWRRKTTQIWWKKQFSESRFPR